jgi:P pilus assembly chaperone PapD
LATVPTGEAGAGVGDLLVSPVRVVLEGRERSAQVTLVNKGSETSIYRVSIVNRRMLQNGAFEVIEEPGPDEKFAGDLVRYAPRRITLEPDAPQTIRILLR